MNERRHVVLGPDQRAYEEQLRTEGEVEGRLEPRMHSHLDSGLTHAHGPTVAAARAPHTHQPVLDWGLTPVSLEKA